MSKLAIRISSDIHNIMVVEKFIEAFSERFKVPEKLNARISLSVIEAVNNAILAGNKMQADKNVDLEAELCGDVLKVTVRDEGGGFDYTNIPDPTLPDNLGKSTGRGLYLMKSLSDELIFSNKGASVTLIYKLG